MRVVFSYSVLGAICLTLFCAPAVAQAGPVTVRVEGANASLLPPTTVATTSGSYTPVGKANACPGNSGAEALDLATLVDATTWGATFDQFGYFVTTIAGESHLATAADPTYWSVWLNHTPAQAGLCDLQLTSGDQLLFFPVCYACGPTYVSPSPLGMTAPDVAQKGVPTSVSVTSYASTDGAPAPANGATVAGGGASATTAGGTASLTFPNAGTFVVRATAPNSVRSEPHTICVHNGNDGNCGTPAPPGTTPPPASTTTTPTTTNPATGANPTACVHAGEDGRCGTADRTPPRGVLSLAEGAHFAPGHGPRLISGRVNPDPSGVPKVLMRLLRVVPHGHGRCQAFDGRRRRFVTARCAVASAPSFAAGSSANFTYLLPTRLPTGRYTAVMEAIDGAGNHDAPAPGRNEIVFRVR